MVTAVESTGRNRARLAAALAAAILAAVEVSAPPPGGGGGGSAVRGTIVTIELARIQRLTTL